MIPDRARCYQWGSEVVIWRTAVTIAFRIQPSTPKDAGLYGMLGIGPALSKVPRSGLTPVPESGTRSRLFGSAPKRRPKPSPAKVKPLPLQMISYPAPGNKTRRITRRRRPGPYVKLNARVGNAVPLCWTPRPAISLLSVSETSRAKSNWRLITNTPRAAIHPLSMSHPLAQIKCR